MRNEILATPGQWSGLAEGAMAHAAAAGRKDGMLGIRRGFFLAESEGHLAVLDDLSRTCLSRIPMGEAPRDQGQMLLAAVRQCYAAGHVHGAEVRIENDARRRRGDAPILRDSAA